MYIFWLFVLGVAVYFIFFANKSNAPASSGSNAMDLLKEKFINGEIDEAEYNRKKNIIEK